LRRAKEKRPEREQLRILIGTKNAQKEYRMLLIDTRRDGKEENEAKTTKRKSAFSIRFYSLCADAQTTW
jgi:hypothetical protein